MLHLRQCCSGAQPDCRDPTYASKHVSVKMLSSIPSVHRHELDSMTSDKWLALRSFICNFDPSYYIHFRSMSSCSLEGLTVLGGQL